MIIPELLSKIEMVAPGTRLRKALDDIVMANFGALLYFVDDRQTHREIIQGGFEIDTTFTPEKLYELSKMDGAVILDQAATRILSANVHLVPDTGIPSGETGMRHRTAERAARQTGNLVVAVSRRRNIITAYFKEYKHIINNINFLIAKIGQALNTLEKHRSGLDRMVVQIEKHEFSGRVKLLDVIYLMIKLFDVLKIREEIEPYIIETGTEGRLAYMQLEEISGDLEDLLHLFVMDYSAKPIEEHEAPEMVNAMRNTKELTPIALSKAFGYETTSLAQLEETSMVPKGYRFLIHQARIPMNIARNVVKSMENMSGIYSADIEALKCVEGIGVKRANAIIDSINMLTRSNNV